MLKDEELTVLLEKAQTKLQEAALKTASIEVDLARLKERNRKSAGEAVAASLAGSSSGTGVNSGDDGTGSISNRSVEELLDHRRLQHQQRNEEQKGAADASNTPTNTTTPTATVPARKRKRSAQIASNKSARGWQQTPNRKWHRGYFVDAEGSTPQPNNDVARRVQWLRDVATSLPSDILTYHHGNGGNEETANEGSTDDGGDVVRSPHQRKTKKPKQKPALRRGNPLTATERASVRVAFVESGGYPDWSRIIASGESAGMGGKKATAWDCFRYVQKEPSSLLLAASAHADAAPGTNTTAVARSSTTNSFLPSQPWGSDEDAALLTAVMSLGPQFVLSRDTVSSLARELFADRSVKQIKKRANESLVNPNYRSPAVRWTDEEERMLVLMMRAYGHCPSPLVKVFGHFSNVASKSIAEKWSRLQGHNSKGQGKSR